MRIGVLLGGCGRYDGTDLYEAVLTCLALEEEGEKPLLLAPARQQDRTVDHLTGDEVADERRDVLRESARLARGPIRALADCRPSEIEALIIPGGYGPVVNFSTGFAHLGEPRRIVPEVTEFLRHFLEAHKPIGVVSLGEVPVRMILGQEIEPTPVPDSPGTVLVDRERSIVSTPGFSAYTRLRDVREGIEAMVRTVLRLMRERRAQEAPGVRAEGPEAGP